MRGTSRLNATSPVPPPLLPTLSILQNSGAVSAQPSLLYRYSLGNQFIHVRLTSLAKLEQGRESRRRSLLGFEASEVGVSFCLEGVWDSPQSKAV